MARETSNSRLIEVVLDDASIGRSTPDVEHERAVAIFDLVEQNTFQPAGEHEGPFRLKLSVIEQRLVFDIANDAGDQIAVHILSLTPFRRIVKDYYMVCESYYEAIKSSSPSQIEAIDMGRRGLHNEGSQTLKDRLDNKIDMDFDTARRLFTLVCVLHWRG